MVTVGDTLRFRPFFRSVRYASTSDAIASHPGYTSCFDLSRLSETFIGTPSPASLPTFAANSSVR